MVNEVPEICLKRRSKLITLIFGERDDLEEVCEEYDDYCAYCHSRITGGGLI